MHRILMLTALLTPLATLNNITDSSPTSTMLPVVFRNVQRPRTSKARKTTMIKEKSDSPMLNYIFDSHAIINKHFHDKFQAPSFGGNLSSEITTIDADTGASVSFECHVTSLRDKLVSWLRVSGTQNLQLLTLDLETHTSDSRYRVDLAADTWRLTLSNAKVTDSGIFFCGVSTHPPLLKRFQLTVHRPEIKLTKEAFLETSEKLSLKCMILHLHSGEVTPVLRWYKGNTSTSLDEIRGGVFVETDLLNLTSHLQVAHLKVEDAGNYTCSLQAPLKMKAVARVHVLQGSSLAELQSGVKTTSSYLSLLLAAVLVVMGMHEDVR